jgi:hypothetical protein
MKKLLFLVILISFATFVSGQKSIDLLFNKYAGKDGFTTVTFNGNLLKLFAGCNNDDDDEDDNSMPSHVSLIRILAQEDSSTKIENFYDMVINDINLSSYDEFMRIKKSDQDLRMLVRTDGDIFKEFLLIAGGEDNALIQIKGEMTFKEAKKFSEDAKKDNGQSIVMSNK